MYLSLKVGVRKYALVIDGYFKKDSLNISRYNGFIFEKQQQMIKDQEMVLSKIRYFKEQDKAKQENCYTNIMNLPFQY